MTDSCATSPSDVALMARVAKLNEQEGRDDVAFRFYQRGLNLLLAQTPLTTQEDTSKNTTAWSYDAIAMPTKPMPIDCSVACW